MSARRSHTLGDLEMAVLDHLWTVGASNAKAVHGVVGRSRAISVNTIQSTLERLHRKGLLHREKVSHAYVYTTAVTRDALMADLIDDVIRSVSGSNSDAMLAAFVAIAERSDETSLQRLEQLISARRVSSGKRSGSSHG
ncbi:MAG: BlaI/MecI/CopY family transcriptional regulator [Gammaproteobacteria bacterium]